MATVGALSPERHFSRDQRPAQRRQRFRKDPSAVSREVTSGSSTREWPRHPSTIRDFEVGVGVNVSQARPWTALAATTVAPATATLGSSEGTVSSASRGLEERFRAVNISDNSCSGVPSWVHVGRVTTAQHSGAVPIHPLQRPDGAAVRAFSTRAAISREAAGAGAAPTYRRGGMGVPSVENGWPPLIAPSRKGKPTAVPVVTVAGPPAVISPTAASGVNPVTIAPLDGRDIATPTAVPRRVSRSLSCDGWVEPARGLPSLVSEALSDDSRHRAPGDKPAKHVKSPAAAAAIFPKGTSPTGRKPLSPSTPRSRPRGEEWNRTKASTPPPPPPPLPPGSVRSPPKQQQRQQQQQHPPPPPQPHVHGRHRYPPWDGNIHPVSPPRQQQQQQQQQQIRQRHSTAPYEAVYWRQSPPPPPPAGAHVTAHRPMHVILTHAEHQMILQHQQHQREQYQHQLHQRDHQLHHREQTHQQHQQQHQHQHQHQQQQSREYPPSRDQRGSLQPREHQHHQHQHLSHREHRRGRQRSENGRDAMQGSGRRRPSPTPPEASRRPLSPPPSSMARSGPPPAPEWQRHVMKGGGMQHRSAPRPFFYPPLGGAVTAAAPAGPGRMPSVQVVGHAGYPHPDSAGHPMHVALPPASVPILSIVTPAPLFSPYAVVTHVPVQRRTANSGGGGGVGGGGRATNGVPNGGGMPMAVASGNSNGHGSGNGSVTGSGSPNDAATSATAGVGGSVANGALHIANGGGGVPVAGGGPVSGGGGGPVTGGGGGSRTARMRVRVHAPNSHKLPSAPSSMIVKAIARGSTCDNRVEVMARAPALEMKRRAESRRSLWKTDQPRVIPPLDDRGLRDQRSREGSLRNGGVDNDDIGVDFGDFGVDRRVREGVERIKGGQGGKQEQVDGWGPRIDTGPVPGGWDYCDGVCTGSESCTGTISSVERHEGVWGAGSCTLSSCSEETGPWGDGDGVGSANESRTGSRAESTISAGEGTDEAEADWPTDLRNSIGIVTDLVVPCQTEIAASRDRAEAGRKDSAPSHAGRFEVPDWESDEAMEDVDEEEREMLAAMEEFYERGRQQLEEHAERHSREAKQRSSDSWPASRTPTQQNAHRRTQR